jgi:hypothetical protein
MLWVLPAVGVGLQVSIRTVAECHRLFGIDGGIFHPVFVFGPPYRQDVDGTAILVLPANLQPQRSHWRYPS